MPDNVVTQVLGAGPMRRVVHLANISDGTGETAVIKVVKASLLLDLGGNAAALVPTSIDIEWARWAVQGFSSVRLFWDHTTDDLAMVLSGNGYEDFDQRGPLADPRSAGGTGDILLTTAGALSGATYDITLGLLLRT